MTERESAARGRFFLAPQILLHFRDKKDERSYNMGMEGLGIGRIENLSAEEQRKVQETREEEDSARYFRAVAALPPEEREAHHQDVTRLFFEEAGGEDFFAQVRAAGRK